MKRTLLIGMLVFALTGCASQAPEETNPETEPLMTDSSAENEEYPAFSDWEEAYRWVLSEEEMANSKHFSLYDVNGDSIPELFVSAPVEIYFARCEVFTYADGLVKIGNTGSYGTAHLLSGGLFFTYTNELGILHGEVERLTADNTFEILLTYDNNEECCKMGGMDEIVFLINDEEVSKDAYTAAISQYNLPEAAEEKLELGVDYTLTEEDIDAAFQIVTEGEKQ